MIDFRLFFLILFFMTTILTFAISYKILAKLQSGLIPCLLMGISSVLISFGITFSLTDMIYAIAPITDVQVIRCDDKQIYEYIYNVDELYENKDVPKDAVLFTTKEWLFIKNVTAEVNTLGK